MNNQRTTSPFLLLYFCSIDRYLHVWGETLRIHDQLQTTKAGRSSRNDDKVSTFNSFPNILMDGWEGLKVYTFEKSQSNGAHAL